MGNFTGNKKDIYEIAKKYMIWDQNVKDKTDMRSFLQNMYFDEDLEVIGGYRGTKDVMTFLFFNSERKPDDIKAIEVLSNF